MKKFFTLLMIVSVTGLFSQSCPTLSPGYVNILPCQSPVYVKLYSYFTPQQSPAAWNYVWIVPPGANYTGAGTGTLQTDGVGIYTLNVAHKSSTCTASSQFTVYACGTGVGENSADNIIAGIFPNPGDGIFTVSVDHEVNATLYNQLGAVISVTKYEKGDNLLDLMVYDPGIYFLRIGDGPRSKVLKLVMIF